MSSFHKASLKFGVVFIALLISLSGMSQRCCDIPVCAAEAQALVGRIVPITQQMGVAPSDSAGIEAGLGLLLARNPNAYRQLMRAIDDYSKWVEGDGQRSRCFTSKIPLDDRESGPWVSGIRDLTASPIEFQSTQFCRGLGFGMELGLGATNLGKSGEGFGGTLRALASYTFAPKDPTVDSARLTRDDSTSLIKGSHCGGTIRLLTGLSQVYQAKQGVTFATFRTEIRLFDLKNDMAALGNVKLMAQVNIGLDESATSFGIGAGLETAIIGIHLLHQWQNKLVDNTTELGFSYRF